MPLPIITSWPDFSHVSEEDDPETERFKYTMCVAVDTDDTVFYAELPLPKADITFEQLTSALKPIPDDEIDAGWPSTVLPCGTPSLALFAGSEDPKENKNFYIKRPRFALYDVFSRHGTRVTRLLGQNLLEEAEVMELLSRNPHPNIIKYHGCVSQCRYLTGIVLDRHSEATIDEYLKQGREITDKQTVMDELESAILHLHSLGWAHNDLNPSNVMVAVDGETGNIKPILIDFRSAKPVGEALGTSRGTAGWIDGKIEDYTTSKKENDIFALQKIRAWIEETTS
ncbi:kinase-like domain-containing protein [Podospora australis]|uniref:Kinase-like domain-containing protein n=1 Tax=Podospora australis TaxID=1536484 RepID=A0AAN6WRL6_9PEZI|nr:kinase-like domain-containing protein [Podospora australis]